MQEAREQDSAVIQKCLGCEGAQLRVCMYCCEYFLERFGMIRRFGDNRPKTSPRLRYTLPAVFCITQAKTATFCVYLEEGQQQEHHSRILCTAQQSYTLTDRYSAHFTHLKAAICSLSSLPR